MLYKVTRQCYIIDVNVLINVRKWVVMEETFGTCIRNKRHELNISLRALSEMTGIDYSMLSKYEKGVVTPPPHKKTVICRALGIPEFKFFDKQNNPSVVHFQVTYRSELDDDSLTRIESLAAYQVLQQANGTCELCRSHFDSEDFLETHYVIWLRNGGSISGNNIVALCPNCHKKVHHSSESALVKELQEIASNHSSKL